MRRFIRAVPVTLLVASLASFLFSRGAETVPLYAARTGNMCAQCHFDPNGGGPRNDFGFMFARNRHSIEAETDSTLPWANLDLTNRIGERMPLYVSLNHRFMLYDRYVHDEPPTGPQPDGLERFVFFSMENSLQLAFQPHSRLTLVYARDAFSDAPEGVAREKDAFGMISLPWESYFRAGRFRNPFGLRMDDHTVATRGAFVPSPNAVFLPYDPRDPDMGFEIGATHAPWFGRFAFTNGDARLFSGASGDFAETKSVKLGFNNAVYQGAVSFYDNYDRNRSPSPSGRKRATRWGYYGMTHFSQLALVGEVVAGTDENEPAAGSGSATGPKTNVLAYFVEANYHPLRSLNFRVRYDRLELDRGDPVPAVRDAATHQRYALEGEYVPVPFAELRAVVRRIDHKLSTADDETEGYLQFHFSY
jgi:hypothetical protein